MEQYEMQWSSATPGLLVVLVDQSEAMAKDYYGKSAATFISMVLNNLVGRIILKSFDGKSPQNSCYISVIGYNVVGVNHIVEGWPKDIDKHPISLKNIKKKISDGMGGITECEIQMPIWIEPRSVGGSGIENALNAAKKLCYEWVECHPDSPAPVIINVFSSDCFPCDKIASDISAQIKNISGADGNTLLFNLTIGDDNDSTDESLRAFIEDMSSPIPASYREYGHYFSEDIQKGDKGCCINKREVENISWIEIFTQRALGFH